MLVIKTENEIIPFAAMLMDLEIIILSMSNKYHSLLLICEV